MSFVPPEKPRNCTLGPDANTYNQPIPEGISGLLRSSVERISIQELFMPTLTFDPTRAVMETPVSINAASTISILAVLCSATSLNFSARAVLTNVSRCLDQSVRKNPSAKPCAEELRQGVNTTLVELNELEMVDPTLASGFLPSDKPVLKLLTRLPRHAPDELFEAVGNMLITAYVTDIPLSAPRAERLNTVVSAIRNEPALTLAQTKELQTLLKRSRDDLLETLVQSLSTQDKATLKFNAQLLTHLRSELNSKHEQEQQSANVRRFMELSSLLNAIEQLKLELAEGQPEALITLIAFCTHLHWDLALQVPLLNGDEQPGVMMWIDAKAGLVNVWIQPLLRELGQPIAGCHPTSDTLRLPLPQVIAQQLQIAVTINPAVRRLGDLISKEGARSNNLEKYWSESRRAQFIRSAPPNAIRMQPNRAVAAYAFLAFHLVTKPDLPYLTISEEQVWAMRCSFFQTVGLGSARKNEHLTPSHVGSQRTVQHETAQKVFEELHQSLAAVSVGRRYTLTKLIEYHNRYTRAVALYLHFATGGRGSRDIEFLASSWFYGSAFGYLDDKNAGASGGLTPVPISPKVSEQLRLWSLHLGSLQMRLSKLLGHHARLTMNRIQAILDYLEVPLFFLLNSDGSFRPLIAKHLFVGRAATLNHDFGRHFMASELTGNGQMLSDVHGFLRHQGAGINPQSAYGIEVQQDRLLRTALSIDTVLTKLGITPLPGLVGGMQ